MCLSIAIERPDDVLGKGEHLGFEWMIINNGMGFRCGYVRIPVGHPWHGKKWDDTDWNPTVHCGITFNEADEPCEKAGSDDAWWIGFDCAHAGDLPDPALSGAGWKSGGQRSLEAMLPLFALLDERVANSIPNGYGEIRTREYVEAQCRSLCEQALKAA